MKTISLTDARDQLAELVGVLDDGPVLLLRNGKPCAALVGLAERFDREAFSLGRDKSLRRLVDGACREVSEGGGIPFSDILREVDAHHSSRKKRPSRPRAKGGATR